MATLDSELLKMVSSGPLLGTGPDLFVVQTWAAECVQVAGVSLARVPAYLTNTTPGQTPGQQTPTRVKMRQVTPNQRGDAAESRESINPSIGQCHLSLCF